MTKSSRLSSQHIIDGTGLDPLNPIHESRLRSIAVLATKPARKMPLNLHFWEHPIAERYRSRHHARRQNRV